MAIPVTEGFLKSLGRTSMVDQKVKLWLPRFKMESTIQMTEQLKQLGE
jgi:serine protease inhibitor